MRETYASLWFSDFTCSPSQITERLGLAPTECWEKGEPWLPGALRQSNAWHLYSPLPRSERFLEQHLEALLEMIEPCQAKLLALAQDYDCGINCVGYFEGEHPGFHLSAKLIGRLNKLSLDVDFDLYCLGGEENETA